MAEKIEIEEKEPLTPDEILNLDDGDNENDEGDEDEGKEEGEKGKEKETAKDETGEDLTKKELEDLKRKYIELATENTLLQRRDRDDEEEEDKPKKSKEYTNEDAIADLTSRDPAKIVAAIERISERTSRKGDEEVRGESQYNQKIKAHEAAVLRDFPQIRSDPKFQQVTSAIYKELEDEARSPRNVYTATATAYALLVKAGELNTSPSNGQNKPKLRIAAKSPTLTKTGDGEDDSDEDDPLSDLTERDVQKMKLNAKRLGVKFEDMASGLRKHMKEDRSYGRR